MRCMRHANLMPGRRVAVAAARAIPVGATGRLSRVLSRPRLHHATTPPCRRRPLRHRPGRHRRPAGGEEDEEKNYNCGDGFHDRSMAQFAEATNMRYCSCSVKDYCRSLHSLHVYI